PPEGRRHLHRNSLSLAREAGEFVVSQRTPAKAGDTTAHGRRGPMQRAHGLEIPQTLEEVCGPRRMALLVYDMQMGIVRHIPDAGAFVARVVQVVEAARRAGVRVGFARHLSLPNELAGVFQLRTAMAWQRVGRG